MSSAAKSARRARSLEEVLVLSREAAICNAFLRWYVAGYKYCVATDTDSFVLQWPNAVTCKTGTIIPVYIAYDDARRYVSWYFWLP